MFVRGSVRALKCLALVLSTMSVARADALSDAQAMFGLSNFPYADARSVGVDGLPKIVLPNVPQPEGLTAVGGATAIFNGTPVREVLFYAASDGAPADFDSYDRKLTGQGWVSLANPSVTQQLTYATFCKPGMPMIVVIARERYLIVRADAFPNPNPCPQPSSSP